MNLTLQPPISSLGIDLAECTGVNVEIGICGWMVEYTADAGLLSPEFAATTATDIVNVNGDAALCWEVK
jgi:hypothetical protein